MTEPRSWREVAESHFGDVRNRFLSVGPEDQKLYWLFYGVELEYKSAAVYAELFFNRKSQELWGLGAVFAKFRGAAAVLITLLEVRTTAQSIGNVTVQFVGRAFADQLQFQCSVAQSLDLEKRIWGLRAINARMDYDDLYGGPLKEVGVWQSTCTDKKQGTSALAMTCPSCFGEDSYVTFAISQEDAEKGLTGYDLYSCNQIAANRACAQCGGQGTLYEEWYLKEHPELARSQRAYTKGWHDFMQPYGTGAKASGVAAHGH
jgi:hypothetical protein